MVSSYATPHRTADAPTTIKLAARLTVVVFHDVSGKSCNAQLADTRCA